MGCDFDSDVDVAVLIVGAGLSGIGMASQLSIAAPEVSYLVVESRADSGGTWDLFNYPGVRSDSDMYTLGYRFRPWPHASALADGPAILAYIRETAEAYGVDEHIVFNRRVITADWSHEQARWTVTLADTSAAPETAEAAPPQTLTARFLCAATGYYDYDEGYTPDFADADRFTGTIVHPQHWPSELDYDDAEVVVIGSGATAVTLVPALAERAARVTMVQRTPTYIAARPRQDRLAGLLRRHLPESVAYRVVRGRNIISSTLTYQVAQRAPAVMKRLLRAGAKAQLPAGYPVDEHFAPPYDPWDQRLCLAPDGDFYRAIAEGKARVITDTIDAFTPTGIRLGSGGEIDADIIVTATGLNLLVLGGMELSLAGEPLVASERIGYKGAMFVGIPNFAVALGYTNASWTLKCDLIAAFVCRVILHMRAHGYQSVTPPAPPPDLPTRPFMDFAAGYVRRSAADLPRQIDVDPWRLHQNYLSDLRAFARTDVADAGLIYGTGVAAGSRDSARR